MRSILLQALIGIVAGVIDILPMLKNKLDRHSILSAFTFYLILPFVILNTELFGIVWWLKGGILALALATPVMLLVFKEDKKAILPMAVMAAVLGTGIGVVGYYLF